MAGALGRGPSSYETGGKEEGWDLEDWGGRLRESAEALHTLWGGEERKLWHQPSLDQVSAPTLPGCVRVRWVGLGL